MAGADAVRTTAIARREVRASIERMQYHLERGPRGVRGVQREVNFLNALHRKTGELGGRAVGMATTVNPSRSFGNETLQALMGANSKTIGRVKSSVLADFSADGLTQARNRVTIKGEQWVWVANASACPTCLSKHGRLYKGQFVPTHPSCLCVPEEPSDEIRPLKQHELIRMQREYGNPRYSGLIDDLEKGRKTIAQVAGVEDVNASAAGRTAVEAHRSQGVVQQTKFGSSSSVEETALYGPEPKLTDYGRFESYDDYLKQYAAETDENARKALLEEWRRQDEAFFNAKKEWQTAQEVDDVLANFRPGQPSKHPRSHLTDLENDFSPPGRKVGRQSALKSKTTDYNGNPTTEVFDLSEASLNERLKATVRQFSDDMGIDLDDDVRWTLDWDEWWDMTGGRHPGASAFVEDGVVYLDPNVVRYLARIDPESYARELRVLAHEMSHQASAMQRRGITNVGLRPVMEEGGAEINSLYWSRYRMADDLLDAIQVRALPTTAGESLNLSGSRAMYWSHNYADDIEELVLQSVRRNGWNRQAVLDDILDFYKNGDDFNGFFKDASGKTVRIRPKGAERFSDDVSAARHKALWDEAPDEVLHGPFSVVDESTEAWPYFFDEAGRAVEEVIGEQKRVANLLNWLMEGDDKVAKAVARKADDVVAAVDDLVKSTTKIVVDEPKPLRVASKHKPKGSATKAQQQIVYDAEDIMGEAVGEHRALFEAAAERVQEVRITASKAEKAGVGKYGEWWESGVQGRRNAKRVDRRLTIEVKRVDVDAHNAWIKEHNDYYARIRNRKIEVRSPDYAPATRTSPPRGTIEFIDNPEYIDDGLKRIQAMDDWRKSNPKPSLLYEADPAELAQTYLHELTHALDYGTGKPIGTTTHRGMKTALQQKAHVDRIDKLCYDIHNGVGKYQADPSFWYAAEGHSKGKLAETVAEVTRMYFFGDRTGTTYLKSNPLGRTAEQWRKAYPELAEWVEKNILTLLPDDISRANLFTGAP